MESEWSLSGAAVLAPWRLRAAAGLPSQRRVAGPTRSETMLWSALSALEAGWVREHVNGKYRLDFFLPSRALAVEVDGSSHHGGLARRHDAERDEWHAARGIETMRVAAEHVERDVWGVLEEIGRRVALREQTERHWSGSKLSASGEIVVPEVAAPAQRMAQAVVVAEAEIESFATGVACVDVLPALSTGWDRFKALARGR